jgi:pimeloyl-ACP methyl ester carboxylesterase
MPAVQLGPAAINYELSGPGQGPLVVLLHEIGGTLETWSQVAVLLPHFRTLRYDQRGAGKSSRIAGAFSLDTQVDDIGGLLDALGERAPCHVAGVAIGAAFAIRFAARHPQRVRSLVLACPAPGVDAARVDYLNAPMPSSATAWRRLSRTRWRIPIRRRCGATRRRSPPIANASSPMIRRAMPRSTAPLRIST